jgi:hypothetical protein
MESVCNQIVVLLSGNCNEQQSQNPPHIYAIFYAFDKLILLQCICVLDYVSYYIRLLVNLFAQYYSKCTTEKQNSAFFRHP